MVVTPSFLCKSLICFLKKTLTFASSAERGSSSNNNPGEVARALAKATRCCSPPDNWLGYFEECSERLTRLSNSFTLFLISSFFHLLFIKP